MNNYSVSALASKATMLTKEQNKNFVQFWTARGWTVDQAVSKLVIADSSFEDKVAKLVDTLKPTAELPSSTVDAVLRSIEHGVQVNGIGGTWDWQGGFNQKGYGIASIYTPEGKKTSISATRLVYRLVTGYTVQPRRIEVLDHLNHDPAVCTDFMRCTCTKSVNPVQLALVTDKENLLRSNAVSGAFIPRRADVATHCVKGHSKEGRINCPTCKREYDAQRYLARTSGLLVAA